MPTIRFSRPFASGSRPTPDPFDKFLDSHGYYRKHTARDSTNLFRVVSEQVYDTQDHHKQVRRDCVNYMIKHRDQYESMIPGDFDKYIREMAKNETFGTLMELRAMGYLFKRNIKLFKPFELGIWYVEDAEYTERPMYVFHASHFDSVFEKSYIVDAAFCQSIVYEMLYKKVYKLPDIEYSVETMLHSDITHEPSSHEYENGDAYATHIVFQDGRKFQLDRPENTCCILSDPVRCHFHNKDFEEFLSQDSKRLSKSILSDPYCSCVRQLLFDGITPFPYKVAKALDENIYRNVEFDSWNEIRKAAKPKQHIFKVGAECLVKLSEIDDELLKCNINSIEANGDTCVIYIAKFGEKRSVPLTCLRPRNANERGIVQSHRHDPFTTKLASKNASFDKYGHGSIDDATSNKEDKKKFDNLLFDYDAICEFSKSLDLNSYINLSNYKYASKNQEIIAYPMVYSQTNMSTNNNGGNTNGGGSKKNRQAQCQNNVQLDSTEKQSKVEEVNSFGKNIAHDSKTDNGQSGGGYYQHQSEHNVESAMPINQQVPNYYHQTTAPVYYCPTPEYNESNMYSNEMVMHPGVYAVPTHAYQMPPIQPNMYGPVTGNQASHYPVHVGGWPGYNPQVNTQGYVFPGPPQYAVPAIPPPVPFQLPFLNRELLRSNGRINFSPNYSANPSGDDLPFNDKVSVRFYYNLGVEYFKLLQQVHGTGQLMAMIDGEPVVGNNYDQPANDVEPNQLATELQQINFESNANEIEIPSPSKPRNNYTDYGYNRRGTNTKYNKRNNDQRQNAGKHFQGSFLGPTSKQYNPKNNQKYNNMSNQASGNSSYDGTPIKEASGKGHQQGHGMQIKRETSNTDTENMNAGNGFGSNVPPFPFHPNDPNELNQHYGPPLNAYRSTPPVQGRQQSVQSIPGTYHHPMHSHNNYWLPPPNAHQLQQAQQQQPIQQQQQGQSQSLNTSGASNPSQ